MTPARRAFRECRMQFPQHCVAPRAHIVGIATFADTVESSFNRIACETAPSARELPAFLAARGDPCVTCLPMTAPSNGGNCIIRGATRRRHADGRLLMVQNPHHFPLCHAPSLVQDCPAGATPPRTAASPPSNGGNCTIRGATRRRHAEGRLLMVQNPHHYPWCHAPSLVQDHPAGADKRR